MTRRRRAEPKPVAAVRTAHLDRVRQALRAWGMRLLVTIVATAFALLVAQRAGFIGAVPFPEPPIDRVQPPSRADFVGAERCASCHAAVYERWKESTHGRAGGAPAPDVIIAAFDGRPLIFADARVAPRRRGGIYEFVVSRDGEADEVLRVDGVVGGGHMEGGGTQGFVTQREDGTLRFLPWDWSRHGGFWFCNTNSRTQQGWVRITPTLPLAACGDWPPVRVLGDLARYANCQSCHASQLTVSLDPAAHRYDTRYTSLAINCESCHGPGRRHVALAERHQLTDSDIGFAPLATNDKDASLRVCFQCHAVKDALRDGFSSGAALEAYYSLGLPALGDHPLTADGRTRTFAYQEGHRFSACYVNGGMTCTSCHEPHGQSYQDVFGTPLAGRFDDRQCTSCHPSKAADPGAHSHHAPSSAGSRCVSCHMPYLQQAETGTGRAPLGVRYARSDHTIPVPRPALDSAMGIRGACASCHPDRSAADLQRMTRVWWGEPKPLPPAVRDQLAWRRGMPADSAWRLLIGEAHDSAGPFAAARSAGLARWFEEYVHPHSALPPGAAERLRELAGDANTDVRALALASLHLADGDRQSTRRFLRNALRRADRAGDGVRARWRVALGFIADQMAAAGQVTADVAYARALELAPDDAHIWMNRANALRAAGAMDSALAGYRRAIALNAAHPLAWLNYGIALTEAGDTADAERALQRAIALEPTDALGYYNLANIAFVRGDTARARALYAQAVTHDQSLVPAHFQLARLDLVGRNARGALRSLRRGLAFDSSNASAAETARRLAAALGVRQ